MEDEPKVPSDKTATMLKLIDERLDAYTVEETIDRLKSYGGAGPTITEFQQLAVPADYDGKVVSLNEFRNRARLEPDVIIRSINDILGDFDLGMYVLENRIPVSTRDMEAWGEFMADMNNKRVARTEAADGNLWVSTVFLGTGVGFGGHAPMLFQTVVFGGDGDQKEARYATWEQAVAGHRLMCLEVGLNPDDYPEGAPEVLDLAKDVTPKE